MSPEKMIIASILVLGFILTIATIIVRNRGASRLLDMKLQIEMILGFEGCLDARKRYDEVKHVSEYYGITLEEAGYDENFHALFDEALASEKRALARQEKTMSDWRRGQIQEARLMG